MYNLQPSREKDKLLVHKQDGLWKHVGHCKITCVWPGVAISEYYLRSFSQHVKKKQQYATFHGQVSMAQQITNGDL
jgi:hypothetical protein